MTNYWKTQSVRELCAILLPLYLLFVSSFSHAESNSAYYSDRFVFRGKDVQNLVVAVLNFDRGYDGSSYHGEFFGSVFHNHQWSFLEGNGMYRHPSKDLSIIQPSYFARATGTPQTGFKVRYDGGDLTFTLGSALERVIYMPDHGHKIRRSIAVAEAVLTLGGRVHHGEMIHEPLIWKGFDRTRRHKGLFREYQGFYLLTEQGREIYLYQNKADIAQVMKNHHFSEMLSPEGGVSVLPRQRPLLLPRPFSVQVTERTRPAFAFYTIPQRWEITTSDGVLYLWSRKKIAKNWFYGGYYLMVVEGVLKRKEQPATNERVWGVAEYVP